MADLQYDHSECKSDHKFSERWDAMYCTGYDEWLEDWCGDGDCPFDCQMRPDYPSDAHLIDGWS